MENFNSRYFRGRGKVLIGTRDANGKPENLTYVGDVDGLTLTPNTAEGEVLDNSQAGGQVGASWFDSTTYDISLPFRSIRKDHLAQALHGNLTDKVGAGVTDESHVAHHDAFILLDHNKVSAVVVTDNTNTTTYAAGTDYALDADKGIIEILSTGAITDLQEVYVDYTYAAQYHVSANPSNTDYYLVFAGVNTADSDKQVRLEVYKVKLSPSVFSMITEQHSTAPVTGKVQTDGLRASNDQLFSMKVEP